MQKKLVITICIKQKSWNRLRVWSIKHYLLIKIGCLTFYDKSICWQYKCLRDLLRLKDIYTKTLGFITSIWNQKIQSESMLNHPRFIIIIFPLRFHRIQSRVDSRQIRFKGRSKCRKSRIKISFLEENTIFREFLSRKYKYTKYCFSIKFWNNFYLIFFEYMSEILIGRWCSQGIDYTSRCTISKQRDHNCISRSKIIRRNTITTFIELPKLFGKLQGSTRNTARKSILSTRIKIVQDNSISGMYYIFKSNPTTIYLSKPKLYSRFCKIICFVIRLCMGRLLHHLLDIIHRQNPQKRWRQEDKYNENTDISTFIHTLDKQ